MTSSMPKFIGSVSRVALRRLADAAITLIVIAFLALFGLIMAERGREHTPAPPLVVAGEALTRTLDYFIHHPATYFWQRADQPAARLIAITFGRSAGLLLVSLGIATLLGIALGLAMALARRRFASVAMLLLSVLGISTPSFLLGMLLWVLNIQMHRKLGITALPATGFGWDMHLVMPALVLAARPLAQIAQITYVAMSEVLTQDYIRTADAKGLPPRPVVLRHAIPNVLVPVLTTLGTSLRFSLASLPVVEYFFIWPGIGLVLLEAINRGMTALVTDLVLCLGAFFLLINLLLEIVYPLLDPRLRGGGVVEAHGRAPLRAEWGKTLSSWWQTLRAWLRGAATGREALPPLPGGVAGLIPRAGRPDDKDEPLPLGASRRIMRSLVGNRILLTGTLLVSAFIALALFGARLSDASPYQVHGVMMIEGTIGAPPFSPSRVFPWGSDHIGRDVQALVLAGARQTLTLALFGTVARILLGTILGLLAGWWHGGRLDRLVTAAVGVWAAFPVTLFAMILIQGLGIQQGMGVFVVAICVVGWGEVAQFVRRQVISIRPQLYIEAARSVGARAARILIQHILPHILSPLLVLGVLEMGGVLMLLAELGFLNVFLGGGFRVQIGEVGRMVPVVAYFSDVPEWGAMLANIRDWWRSYPWMAWYPGGAFFLAILAFNLWGEGLRRFLNDSRVNVGRLINRYSFAALAVVAVGLIWLLRSTSPLEVYRTSARSAFDADRAVAHVRALTSPTLEGRESGHPGAQAAAAYIADQMAEIGLFPGGDAGSSFIQTERRALFDLKAVPRLEILDAAGNVSEALEYRRDFSELADPRLSWGMGSGSVVGLALGPAPDVPGNDPYLLRSQDLLRDKILLLHEPDLETVNVAAAAGALVVRDDPATLLRRQLYVQGLAGYYPPAPGRPIMYITPEVAERLLATAGSSLAGLDALRKGLGVGQVAVTAPGATVRLVTVVQDTETDLYHVVGYIPGTGSEMHRPGEEGGLDRQVIMVSAYYDGLGVGPEGTLYPGANDNASGVATMLELARALKESPYQPKKTVIFVAWSGGERYEDLSVTRIMNGRLGFNQLNVEAVIELSGVAAGSGRGLALREGSSYRLVKLMQEAAGRLGATTTTRGRGPHYGMYRSASFGGRDALTLEISWDGADRTAHTPQDTFATISPEKLRQVGQTTLLVLHVLTREVDY